jgi:hypothetical protein
MTREQRLAVRQLKQYRRLAQRMMGSERYETRLRAEGRYRAFNTAIKLMEGIR